MSLAILGGLPTASHSLALSHYWPTQRLLAAGFPLWPIPPRLRQPDPPWLPREVHVDAGLSADAGSTWTNGHQKSLPQAIQQNLPPSSWITRACQSSRRLSSSSNQSQKQNSTLYTFALSSVFDIIYGHIMLKAPVLVRSLQLSNIELCWYLDGWPSGNTQCYRFIFTCFVFSKASHNSEIMR